MKRLELANLVRARTKTDTNTFPDATLLLYANTWMYEIAKRINEVNEDYFGMTATRNIVAGQREYNLPSDVLNAIKSVEIKFSADGRWMPLAEFDILNFKRPTSELDITQNFKNEEGYACYDIYGNSLFIYSGALGDNVEGGLKLHYFIEPKPLPDVTDNTSDMSADPDSTNFGFPKAFHELLARRICIEYKENAQQPIPLNNLEQKYDLDLEVALNNVKGRNMSRAVIAKVPMINGYTSQAHLPFPLRTENYSSNMYGYE